MPEQGAWANLLRDLPWRCVRRAPACFDLHALIVTAVCEELGYHASLAENLQFELAVADKPTDANRLVWVGSARRAASAALPKAARYRHVDLFGYPERIVNSMSR